MITMNCPNCGHLLRIHRRYAGRQGKCKHCNAKVDVPATTPSEPPPAPPSGSGLSAVADLQIDEDWQPPKMPEGGVAGAGASIEEYKRLGCLYWGCVILLTPVALIWGLVLPKGHPQKKMAVLVPAILMAVSLLLVVILFAGLSMFFVSMRDLVEEAAVAPATSADQVTINPPTVEMPVSPSDHVRLEIMGRPEGETGFFWKSSDATIARVVGNEWSAMVYGMAPGTAVITAEGIMHGQQTTAEVTVVPAPRQRETATAPPHPGPGPGAARPAPTSSAATGIPQYPGLTLAQTSPQRPNHGPLSEIDEGLLRTFEGVAADDYETVFEFYKTELPRAGWQVIQSGVMRAPEQRSSIQAYKGDDDLFFVGVPAQPGTHVTITVGTSRPSAEPGDATDEGPQLESLANTLWQLGDYEIAFLDTGTFIYQGGDMAQPVYGTYRLDERNKKVILTPSGVAGEPVESTVGYWDGKRLEVDGVLGVLVGW